MGTLTRRHFVDSLEKHQLSKSSGLAVCPTADGKARWPVEIRPTISCPHLQQAVTFFSLSLSLPFFLSF